MRRTPLAALALGMLLPLAAQAQEEEQQLPRGLFISQWICPQASMQGIGQNYDSLTVPIEQELVNEGLLDGAGMFFHSWGDEWNVVDYFVVDGLDGFFANFAEFTRRINEANPTDGQDELPAFNELCTEHKDSIYRIIPPPGG